MTARIERILFKLSQQHAPHLTPPGWEQRGDPIDRVQKLARKLASYDIVVLVGDLPNELVALKEIHIQDWIRGYAQLYNLLANGLFPSFGKLDAQYADNRMPPIVVLKGQSTPVMTVFAGCICPYMGLRQPARKQVTDLELRGLMDYVLGELEANDLPRAVYDSLRETGIELLRQMLASTVRHVSLTLFDKPELLKMIQPPAPPTGDKQQVAPPAASAWHEMPDRPAPPANLPPPPTAEPAAQQAQLKYELEYLPEDSKPPTPTQEMFVVNIPLTPPKKGSRRPPVPDLPKDDE